MGRERWGLKRAGDVWRRNGITPWQLRYWVETRLVTPAYRALGSGDNHLFDARADMEIAAVKLMRRAGITWKGVRMAVERGYAAQTAEMIRAVLDDERQGAYEEG